MTTRGADWGWKLCLVGFVAASGVIAGNDASAQIVPDATLGAESSSVTPNAGNVDAIAGGATRGANLFHSFEQFSVLSGREALFNSASNIQNIISRVTGGSRSNIDGVLRANGSANLFLLNPNGITFGPNARLNIGGSFVGSTASAVNFADGTQFSATAAQTTPLLTISVPTGLQFGSQPGGITSQAVSRNSQGNAVDGLRVASGHTLALIGGEIGLDGSFLAATNGQVQLAAVGGETTVGLNVNGSALGFNIPENASRSPIALNNRALVTTDGDSAIGLVGGQIELNDSAVFGSNGGSISISATQLALDNNSAVLTGTTGAVKAGDIQIQANDAVSLTNSSLIGSNSSDSATGNGGDIAINARTIAIAGDGTANGSSSIQTLSSQGNGGNLTLNATESVNNNGGFVSILAGGAGNAGSLTVRAGNTVNVTNRGILSLFTNGSGSTGNMRIETGTLRVQNAGQSGAVAAVAAGTGNTGSISVQARDAVELIDASIFTNASVGRAGDILIETPRVNLRDGGQVSTDTFSSANAGNIVIRASESVDIRWILSDFSLPIRRRSDISSETNGGTGNGGNVTIETPRLTLSQGGAVTTTSFRSRGNAGNISIRAQDVELDGFVTVPSLGGESFVTELDSEVIDSDADVRGGTIAIDTERLRVSNGANVDTSVLAGRGQGGNLVVRATDSIDITGSGPTLLNGLPRPSGLFAELQTDGIGSGGSISVETGRLHISDGGQISASTFNQGNAGDISISAAQIDLSGENAFIATVVDDQAKGDAGNLNITTDRLLVRDGAGVSSSTLGIGDAGNLTIRANQIDLIGGGLLSVVAPGANGNGGTLSISTDNLIIRDGAFISTSTFEQGQAGDIILNASGSIEVVGLSPDGQFSRVLASSQGEGQAGNITASTPRLTLLDRGTVAAESNTVDGGNITLNVDNLLLRRNSGISATAGVAQGAGNGGNVTINANTIVAVPTENSDISANAFTGRGGRVNISTQGIFGIQSRPRSTSLSDITASSSGGIAGVVEINSLDIDPSQGLVELPQEVVDTSNQIASACVAGENQFKVIGRGGLPPNPQNPLDGEAVLTNWATLEGAGSREQGAGSREQGAGSREQGVGSREQGVGSREQGVGSREQGAESREQGAGSRGAEKRNSFFSPSPPLPLSPSSTIVEASGWMINDKGEVVLTAAAPITNQDIPWLPASNCHASQSSS